jgi:hypothetical protein
MPWRLVKRSYWIPGSEAPTLPEKCNAFLRPLKNKDFKEERVTSMRLDNLSTSTTLESNKSHFSNLLKLWGGGGQKVMRGVRQEHARHTPW